MSLFYVLKDFRLIYVIKLELISVLIIVPKFQLKIRIKIAETSFITTNYLNILDELCILLG
jgi:hypothetical protein